MLRAWCGLVIVLSGTAVGWAAESPATSWKASLKKARITPPAGTWMAGYASRDRPAEGIAQELYAKAFVAEDKSGRRLAIVTLDLIGVPRALYDAVQQRVALSSKIDPQGLLINASHTHCGPELRGDRAGIAADPEKADARASQAMAYTGQLQQTIITMIEEAAADLQPVTLGYSHARCGFAMNRRLPTDKGYQNSPYPDGPVDHDVPVLQIRRADGALMGVLFGYACHNTTLSFYQFCGDYAGYAQAALEAAHEGAIAMFVLGCGGDQNPYPRGTLELCQQHGGTLATAVEAALLPQPSNLDGPLATERSEVTLPFAPAPSRQELEEKAKSTSKYEAAHARRLLAQIDEGTGPITEYAVPVQVIRFGTSLTIAALAGEVVVDYSRRLKQEHPEERLWVAGYSNDVFGYVPSLRVLKEGGYEAGGAMLYTRFPGPFRENVEDLLITEVNRLLERTRDQLAVTTRIP